MWSDPVPRKGPRRITIDPPPPKGPASQPALVPSLGAPSSLTHMWQTLAKTSPTIVVEKAFGRRTSLQQGGGGGGDAGQPPPPVVVAYPPPPPIVVVDRACRNPSLQSSLHSSQHSSRNGSPREDLDDLAQHVPANLRAHVQRRFGSMPSATPSIPPHESPLPPQQQPPQVAPPAQQRVLEQPAHAIKVEERPTSPRKKRKSLEDASAQLPPSVNQHARELLLSRISRQTGLPVGCLHLHSELHDGGRPRLRVQVRCNAMMQPRSEWLAQQSSLLRQGQLAGDEEGAEGAEGAPAAPAAGGEGEPRARLGLHGCLRQGGGRGPARGLPAVSFDEAPPQVRAATEATATEPSAVAVAEGSLAAAAAAESDPTAHFEQMVLL